MTKLKTPHDRLFHFAFQDPEVVRAELRAVLPPEFLARLDLSTLEPVRDRLVDAKLGNLFTDVIYRVKLAGEDALIWALLEHQSSPDGLMPLRVLQYEVGIWSAYVLDDERRARGKLPVIIPVVITHGRAATAPRSIVDLLDASPEVVRVVRPLYPEAPTWSMT